MADKTTDAPPATPAGDIIEAWYRERFCDRQFPYETVDQNEIRAAVDDLKTRL